MPKLNALKILFATALFACNQQEQKHVDRKDTVAQSVGWIDSTNKQKTPITINEPEGFEAFETFWEYYTTKIKLNEDFVAYNVKRNRISKLDFLQQLSLGNYQPIQINPTDSIRYQLIESPANAKPSISGYMKMFARNEINYYKMEGKPIPYFNFKDLDGTPYSSANTKGKYVLFKCWFIKCGACVLEMPDLNKMVAKYTNRKDILFISLATDKNVELKKFLDSTKFDYKTVGMQRDYMQDKLHVASYPTHFLIDKKGNLYKVAPDAVEAEMFLERLLERDKVSNVN